jgi:hypothetical protein
MKSREKAALQQHAIEGLVQAAALMIHPTDQNVTDALLLTTSVMLDLVRYGGERTVDLAMSAIAQLQDEGVLAP